MLIAHHYHCFDQILEKTLSSWCHLYLGIAQIAITPLPPRTQTGTLGHFFSGAILPFYHFYHFFLPFSLNKCPKPSGQGFRPPQNQANAHLILANSSLKKCPKPMNFNGASLTESISGSVVPLAMFFNFVFIYTYPRFGSLQCRS